MDGDFDEFNYKTYCLNRIPEENYILKMRHLEKYNSLTNRLGYERRVSSKRQEHRVSERKRVMTRQLNIEKIIKKNYPIRKLKSNFKRNRLGFNY
jgi:hypothetical protein